MSSQQETLDTLRTMLKQALRGYMLAHLVRSEAVKEQARKEERIGQLAAMIEDVEQRGRELLHQAGLAHVIGTSLDLESEVITGHQTTDGDIAAAFTAAQLSFADLQVALLRLGQALADQGLWEQARRAVVPLLVGGHAPLMLDALDLFRRIGMETANWSPGMIIVPDIEDSRSIMDYFLINWKASTFSKVNRGEELFTIRKSYKLTPANYISPSDNIITQISPISGVLVLVFKQPGATVERGEALGIIVGTNLL